MHDPPHSRRVAPPFPHTVAAGVNLDAMSFERSRANCPVWSSAMKCLQPRCCGFLPARFDKAFPRFDRAAELFRLRGDTENQADALLMGVLCRQKALKYLDTAERKLREARRLYGGSLDGVPQTPAEAEIRQLFHRTVMHC